MRKSANYWSKDVCSKEALKYNTKNEFKHGSPSAYSKVIKNNWVDELCQHMKKVINPPNYWVLDRCHIEALKYQNKGKFIENSSSAYYAARKNGWLNEICSHMVTNQPHKKRYVYAFEFIDNHVYIGLTCDMNKRSKVHLGLINSADSAVLNYIKKTKINPTFKILVNTPIDESDAAINEIFFINEYKKNNWFLLNKIKGGGLGGNIFKWSIENLMKEALKYNTRSEFQKKSCGAYNAARRNNCLNEICSHMIEIVKPIYYWTYENCKNEAIKYNKRNDFHLESSSAYDSAHRNNWLNEICLHMKRPNNNQFNLKIN
jgi:hypothetical protein